MRTKALALLLVATLWGCSDAPASPEEMEQQQDDHATVVLEGSEVSEGLDGDHASPAFETPTVFFRLGLMWDAPVAGALEVSTSLDGLMWSDWQPLVEAFAEEGLFSGHVDAPDGAQLFRYRVADPASMPTWLNFVPLEEIPVIADDRDMPLAAEEPETGDGLEPYQSFTIRSRASWGARKPRCASSTVPKKVTIHHTVTPTNDSMTPQARLRQIQAFHMYTMGWCDIGYNYLVSRDGRVWKGRGKNRLGAHVANHNSGNVGISFLGNYSHTKANRAQRCGTASLLRWLHAKNPAIKLYRYDIKGHRQYGATACPGDALYGQLNGIVRLARDGGCR